jgi:hypothetical protein
MHHTVLSETNEYFLYPLQADYCAKACHFTPYVRNPKCLNGSWDGEQVTKTTEKTPTEVQITAPNSKCSYSTFQVYRQFTVDFTKLWPRQLRGWFGIWEL